MFTVISDAHPNTVPKAFQGERNQLILPQMIGVPNNVRARFVYPEHHEHSFLFGQRKRLEKAPDELSHQSEIAGMARELDFLFLH